MWRNFKNKQLNSVAYKQGERKKLLVQTYVIFRQYTHAKKNLKNGTNNEAFLTSTMNISGDATSNNNACIQDDAIPMCDTAHGTQDDNIDVHSCGHFQYFQNIQDSHDDDSSVQSSDNNISMYDTDREGFEDSNEHEDGETLEEDEDGDVALDYNFCENCHQHQPTNQDINEHYKLSFHCVSSEDIIQRKHF